ncbi:unnamed protein product [Mytilus coruscus]|uniref:Uncharacterized protein n=1 Tax=Mytilus coruscus TaxID=42192 RepID=A0A6J8BYT7_MYTCO|nr:unnamed protein product [Mytilus coruscus]
MRGMTMLEDSKAPRTKITEAHKVSTRETSVPHWLVRPGTRPLGYVDKTQKKETELNKTRGILDPDQEDIRVQLINFREEPVTVHAKEHIGVCESYYEMPAVGVCNHIGTEGTRSEKLPSHIEDLFNRSIVHLQEKEKQQLKELLQLYSDVFAKSADALGRTNRVQHRINTGTALPKRQAPRRLPLGKREIEKKGNSQNGGPRSY